MHSLDDIHWSYTTRRFRTLEYDFAVRTIDPALGRYLERILAPFADPGRPSKLYSLFERVAYGQQYYSVFCGSELVQESRYPALVIPALLWHVNRQTIESCERYLLIHAAAAEREGHAFLFPAPSESGKTTLVAGLVKAGFGYLSDEVAVIDPSSLRVHPFAKALTIDFGSWNVLPDLEPVVEQEMRAYLGKQWQVEPRTIRADAVAAPASARFVVFPSYTKGADTELARLRPAQALVALCENSFNFIRQQSTGLKVLTAIVNQSQCYRLKVGDLDTACALLLRQCSTN